MNELALCAGAGGGILGAQLLGHRTVAAVEIDPYRREVLLRRQCDGVLPVFPIWDDLRTFDGGPWRGVVDCVTAGFPCPPFSVAGKGLAGDDPRNLWPDVARILGEVGPDFTLLENVAGLLAHGYTGRILGDLAALGMDALWDCVPASAVGAPHRRDRVWILAYTPRDEGWSRVRIVDGRQRARGRANGTHGGEVASPVPDASSGGRTMRGGAPRDARLAAQFCEDVADSKGELERAGLRSGGAGSISEPSHGGCSDADAQRERLEGFEQVRATPRATDGSGDGGDCSWWSVEPDVGRVANGVACRVDRLSALGDGQVPAVVVRAWRELRANL